MFLYLSQIRICQLEICGETRSRKEREMWGKFLFCATFPWMRNHLRVEMASSSLMLPREGKGLWVEGERIFYCCYMFHARIGREEGEGTKMTGWGGICGRVWEKRWGRKKKLKRLREVISNREYRKRRMHVWVYFYFFWGYC